MSNIILHEKNIILSTDGTFPDPKTTSIIQTMNPDSLFFEEKINNLQVLTIKKLEGLPHNTKSILLREYYASHSIKENFQAFRSKALSEWRIDCQYCSKCGKKLIDNHSLTARECPQCHNIIFPRISPCIIVVVEKEGKILLAKHTYRNQDMYACIAGFMEAGESAEEAVHREVFEETGLKIKNLVYRGSQSWPFPDQLMLGFTAEWESGEIKLQKEELSDAKWFDPDNCPSSPKPGSIAYRLIHKLY